MYNNKTRLELVVQWELEDNPKNPSPLLNKRMLTNQPEKNNRNAPCKFLSTWIIMDFMTYPQKVHSIMNITPIFHQRQFPGVQLP
jgi:hypothetical protein